jgi:hypothetical protein
MNNIIKKLANFNAYVNANPFSIIYSKFSNIKTEVSDFFAFRLDGYETIFVAENSLALLLGKHVDCIHVFHFFDVNGAPCGLFKAGNDKFHHRLKINKKITNNVVMGSFVHHVQYEDNILKQCKALLADISFQHRGYTGFRKEKDFGYSYVHGNFGAVYFDKSQKIKSLARLRSRHVYVPQFIIKPSHEYELIFSNPTNKKTCLEIFLINDIETKSLKNICLNPHATYKFTLQDLDIKSDYNISWETSFPIGRCVVFEYHEKYFDVFHS